jgi:hypothetical protein
VPLLMRRARACGLCCTDLQKNRKGPQDTGQNAMEWDTDISLTCTSDAPRNRALTRNRDGFPTKPSRRFRWDVPRGPTQAGHWGPGAESEDLRRRSQGDQGSACVPKRRGDRREALNVEGSPRGAGIHQAINRTLKLRGIAQRLTGWKREASRGKPLRMQFVDFKRERYIGFVSEFLPRGHRTPPWPVRQPSVQMGPGRHRKTLGDRSRSPNRYPAGLPRRR